MEQAQKPINLKPSVKSALERAHDELDRVANTTYNIHEALIGIQKGSSPEQIEEESNGIVIDTIKHLTEKLRVTNELLQEINQNIQG